MGALRCPRSFLDMIKYYKWEAPMEIPKEAENGMQSFQGCRTIAYTILQHENGIYISTIFLGIDHNHLEDGPPILFETIIRNNSGIMLGTDDYQTRCNTYSQALVMHQDAVDLVIKAIRKRRQFLLIFPTPQMMFEYPLFPSDSDSSDSGVEEI